MIIVSETERDRNMMKFAKYDTKAIDINTAWMATNAVREIDISENINDEYSSKADGHFNACITFRDPRIGQL